jgi:hypothetical protein
LIQLQYPTGGPVPPFHLEEEMNEKTLPTQKTPRRRVRKNPSEWVFKFAPPPVEGQLHFEFDFEPDEEGKEDE